MLLLLLLKTCILLRKLQIYESHDKFVAPRSLKDQLYLREPLDRIQYYLWVTIFSISLWGEQYYWLIIFDTLRLLSISRTKQFKLLCIFLNILFNNTAPLRTWRWKQFYCYSPVLKTWLYHLSAWRLIRHIHV